MKKSGLVILLLFVGVLVSISETYAQEQGKIYFDKNWKVAKKKSQAAYYRKWKKLEEDKYLINDHYLSGELQMKVMSTTRRDLDKIGVCTWFYKNGNIKYKGFYKNNELHGTYLEYYEDGDLQEITQYDEGDRHGLYRSYYHDSIIKCEGEYAADDREELWKWYYVNGQLAEEVRYEDNIIDGKRKGYYPDGNDYFTVNFNEEGNREGEFLVLHNNGNVERKGRYSDGKKVGAWKSYYENGQLLLHGVYGGTANIGKRIGTHTWYYNDGKVKAELNYQAGKLEGQSQWFYSNGQVAVSEIYSYGTFKKRKGFSEDGKKLKSEQVYDLPSLTHERVETLLNQYKEHFYENNIYDVGVVVDIDSNDRISDVEIVGDLKDSTLVEELSQLFVSQSTTSRIQMNKKRASVEAYLFAFLPDVKEFEPTWWNQKVDYEKFPYFNGNVSPDLSEEADTANVVDVEVFTIVEDMPNFSGGESELYKFLGSNTRYPPEAVANGEDGVVYVTFIVDEFGHIREARVLRGVSDALDKEALRVVKLMPLWRPGFQRGKPVRVQFNIPLRFKLSR